MEGQSINKKILIAVGFVLFFVVIVLVWYFYYAKPIIDPTSEGTRDPFLRTVLPPRFQFIGKEWNTEDSTSTTELIDPSKEPFVKIWDKPTTGQTFIIDTFLKEVTASSTEGTSTILVKKTVRATSTTVLFVDKITGYVYGYTTETGQVFQISNTLLPGIYDAYFFDQGKRIIMRYLEQEKNTVVGIIATVPMTSNKEEALPLENIEYLSGEVASISVRNDSNEASYVVMTESGSTIYLVSGSAKPRIITSSPFRELDIAYGNQSLYVTTKPSAYVEGGTFRLPGFQSEIADKTGLMTLPGGNNIFLSSMWGKQGLATFITNYGENTVLPIKTLVEKCTFGLNNLLVCAVPKTIPKVNEGLPDDWFQGRVSFDDDLMVIDMTTFGAYPLYSFDTKKDGVFDVDSLVASKDSTLFSLTRRTDGTLWLLNTALLAE